MNNLIYIIGIASGAILTLAAECVALAAALIIIKLWERRRK